MATRLDSFIRATRIRAIALARESGISRQHVYRLRMGRSEPTIRIMVVLAVAAQRILQRKVDVREMFDLGDGEARPPLLEFVEEVTREHGRSFSAEFFNRALASEAVYEAFGRSGILRWPAGADVQARYRDIEDEILNRTFAVIRRALSAAFVIAANEVLTRERRYREQHNAQEQR